MEVVNTIAVIVAVLTPTFGQLIPRSPFGNNGQTTPTQGTAGACTPQEARLALQPGGCIVQFGYSHLRFLQALASRPTCQAEIFNCGRVDQLIGCLNRLTVQQVSNQCWRLIPELVTRFFQTYRIPCTFDDIEQQCRTVSQDLLTVAERSQQGNIIPQQAQNGGTGGSDAPSMLEQVLRSAPSAFQQRSSGSSSSASSNLPQQSNDANGPSVLERILYGDNGGNVNSAAQQGNTPNSQQSTQGQGQNGASQLGNGLVDPTTQSGGNPDPSSQAQSGAQQQNQNAAAAQSQTTQQQFRQSAAALNLQPSCTNVELNLVFQKCARLYGYAHYRYFSALAQQPSCRAEVFNCQLTNRLMGCLNGLPVSQVSQNCWAMMPEVLTNFFQRYNLPCTFDDIKQQCTGASQNLLTPEKRMQQQGGFGMGMGKNMNGGMSMNMNGGMGGALSQTRPQQQQNQNTAAAQSQSGAQQQSSQSASTQNLQPMCTSSETNVVFRRCARSYGYYHYRHFQALARQRICQAQVFNCQRTNQLMGCINGLSVSQVSNNCFVMMPDVLTSFFQRYNVPCNFDDIKQQCRNVSQDLLTVDQRNQQQGVGMNARTNMGMNGGMNMGMSMSGGMNMNTGMNGMQQQSQNAGSGLTSAQGMGGMQQQWQQQRPTSFLFG